MTDAVVARSNRSRRSRRSRQSSHRSRRTDAALPVPTGMQPHHRARQVWPVRLRGTENRHKAIQKSRAEMRFLSGSGLTFITASQSAKSFPLKKANRDLRNSRRHAQYADVRNLRHLRRVRGARRFKGFSLQNTYAEVATLAICFARSSGCPREAGVSRTSAGRLAAKARGGAFGRPKKMQPNQQELARELVRGGKSAGAVAKTFNVHPATIHRVLEG